MWSRCFYWRREIGLAGLSNSLNMSVKPTKTFRRAFEKNILLQKMRFCQNILTWFQTSFYKISTFFEVKLFFQRLVENFLWTLRTCSSYLKGPPNLVLCVSKKIVTTRRTNQIICQEKWKKLRFCRMKLEIGLEYSDIQVNFWWRNSTFWAQRLTKTCFIAK